MDDIVAADPSQQHLHGCFGNACMSHCVLSYIGGGQCLANVILVPPVYRAVGGEELGCCEAIFCAHCAICQLSNEVSRRRSTGMPVTQGGMQPVVMMPAVQMAPMQQAYSQPQANGFEQGGYEQGDYAQGGYEQYSKPSSPAPYSPPYTSNPK